MSDLLLACSCLSNVVWSLLEVPTYHDLTVVSAGAISASVLEAFLVLLGASCWDNELQETGQTTEDGSRQASHAKRQNLEPTN